MSLLVLDSWGLIAWLKGEPAARQVRDLFEQAESGAVALAINVINLGEVLYIAARHRGWAQAQLDVAMLRTRLQVLPARDDIVQLAARLKAAYRISYADGFAAATAVTLDAPLVTGDPELAALARALPLQLHWIGA